MSSPLRDPSQEEPESLSKETTSTLAALLGSTLGVTLVTSKSEYCSSISSVYRLAAMPHTSGMMVDGMNWYILWRHIGDSHSVKCICLEIIQNINYYSAHLGDPSASPSCDLSNNKAKVPKYIYIWKKHNCLFGCPSVCLVIRLSLHLSGFLSNFLFLSVT